MKMLNIFYFVKSIAHPASDEDERGTCHNDTTKIGKKIVQ